MAGREFMNGSIPAKSSAGAEAEQIRELVQKAAEPEGFPAFELSFGEDSTGDPAVWIWFLIENADEATTSRLKAMRRLRERVQTTLFEHQIGRIPYIRYREALPSKR